MLVVHVAVVVVAAAVTARYNAQVWFLMLSDLSCDYRAA